MTLAERLRASHPQKPEFPGLSETLKFVAGLINRGDIPEQNELEHIVKSSYDDFLIIYDDHELDMFTTDEINEIVKYLQIWINKNYEDDSVQVVYSNDKDLRLIW